MNTIEVLDKEFEIYLKEEEVLEIIGRLAERINRDYEGLNPLILPTLNGSFMFCADLMKRITIPCEIQFIKLSSYQGTSTTGTVSKLIGIDERRLKGRHVLILEDVIDTGITMKYLTESLEGKGQESLKICTMLFKPENLQVPLDVEYVGKEIPDRFIVGYGLDYDQYGRNFPAIYQLKK